MFDIFIKVDALGNVEVSFVKEVISGKERFNYHIMSITECFKCFNKYVGRVNDRETLTALKEEIRASLQIEAYSRGFNNFKLFLENEYTKI